MERLSGKPVYMFFQTPPGSVSVGIGTGGEVIAREEVKSYQKSILCALFTATTKQSFAECSEELMESL